MVKLNHLAIDPSLACIWDSNRSITAATEPTFHSASPTAASTTPARGILAHRGPDFDFGMPHALPAPAISPGALTDCRPWCTRSKPKMSRGRFKHARTAALLDFFTRPSQKAAFKPSELRQIGPLEVSPMGLGTWSWGNQFLWGYDKSQDADIQQVFNLMVSKGINIFDTADSYGKCISLRTVGHSQQPVMLKLRLQFRTHVLSIQFVQAGSCWHAAGPLLAPTTPNM